MHAAQTISSLRAGKHVLCEKPMAMDYTEAGAMQRTAEETGRTLGVAYYRRMYPKVNRAKELIEAGVIGKPIFAEAANHYWFYPEDGFRAWLVDPKLAGRGPLYDIASHRIDLFNYLFGQPKKATGYVSALVHPTAVEDNATVLIEYGSGVRGMVDVRWHSRTPRDEFRIRGTEGEIDLTPLNEPALIYPGGKEEIPAPQNLHYPCVENFVSAVQQGVPPRSSGATALVTEWVTNQIPR
jgi:1,5-anhydro-D-fructose reductase (1,5-anhydro-D-mannitol-forming)